MKIVKQPVLTEKVLMSYAPYVKQTVKKYVTGNAGFWVSDLTQDVLLKAWKNRHHFNPKKGDLSNWLYTMAKHAALDWNKKKSNSNVSLQPEFFPIMENEPTYMRSLSKRELRAVMHGLCDRDRKLLILKYFFDCTGREMASLLKLPENQVASYLKRAKGRLKELLDYPQAA
jgi:RNA polymerase sigma factor (sigma-70 family)